MAKDRVERDEEDLVRLYLSDIGQYPLLTKEDEVRLARAIEDGVAAGDELAAADGLSVGRRRELRWKRRRDARLLAPNAYPCLAARAAASAQDGRT